MTAHQGSRRQQCRDILTEVEACGKPLKCRGWVLLHRVLVCKLSHFSHVQLFASSMDCSLSGSSAHKILQVRTLEWVAMPSFSGPEIEPTSLMSPALARGFFTTSTTWETLLLHLNLVLYLVQIVKGLKKPEK